MSVIIIIMVVNNVLILLLTAARSCRYPVVMGISVSKFYLNLSLNIYLETVFVKNIGKHIIL